MTPGSVLGGCGFESPLGQSFSPPVINESQLVDSASSPEEDGGGGGEEERNTDDPSVTSLCTLAISNQQKPPACMKT